MAARPGDPSAPSHSLARLPLGSRGHRRRLGPGCQAPVEGFHRLLITDQGLEKAEEGMPTECRLWASRICTLAQIIYRGEVMALQSGAGSKNGPIKSRVLDGAWRVSLR